MIRTISFMKRLPKIGGVFRVLRILVHLDILSRIQEFCYINQLFVSIVYFWHGNYRNSQSFHPKNTLLLIIMLTILKYGIAHEVIWSVLFVKHISRHNWLTLFATNNSLMCDRKFKPAKYITMHVVLTNMYSWFSNNVHEMICSEQTISWTFFNAIAR